MAASLAAVGLGCVTSGARQARDRPVAYAVPATDPALADNVQRKLLATNIERVSAQVAPAEGLTRVEVLAPELSPVQADEARREFAEVPWRPSEGGGPTWVVTIGR